MEARDRCAPLSLALVIGLFSLLIAASEDSISILRLDLLVPAFKNVQFSRYALPLKTFWYAFAGMGAAWLLTTFSALLSRDRGAATPPSPAPSPRLRYLLAILLAPALISLIHAPSRLAPHPVGNLSTFENTDFAEADSELRAALDHETGPLRVAFLRQGMGGATFPLFAIADSNAKVVLDGHIPAVNYRWQSRASLSSLRRLGATHIIHDRPLDGDRSPLAEYSEPIGKFGPYTLAPTSLHHGSECAEKQRPRSRLADREQAGARPTDRHRATSARDHPPSLSRSLSQVASHDEHGRPLELVPRNPARRTSRARHRTRSSRRSERDRPRVPGPRSRALERVLFSTHRPSSWVSSSSPRSSLSPTPGNRLHLHPKTSGGLSRSALVFLPLAPRPVLPPRAPPREALGSSSFRFSASKATPIPCTSSVS